MKILIMILIITHMVIIIIFITTKSSLSIGPKGFICRQGKDSPMNNIDSTCPKAPEVSPVLWYLFIGCYVTCWQQSHMGKKGPGSKLEIGLALPDVWGDKIKMHLDQLSSSSPFYIYSVKLLSQFLPFEDASRKPNALIVLVTPSLPLFWWRW